MSGAAITGAALLTALGDRAEAVHGALLRGESGVAEVSTFELDGLRCRRAAALAAFDPIGYLGRGNFRPLDRTGRLAVVAAELALADSGWSRELRAEHEVGLVLGTTFGSVHTISAFDRRALTAGPNYVKPLDFANSVINAAAGQTAIWHDLRAVNATVSGGAEAGLEAIGYAADRVAEGRAAAVLAGGAEELCFESFYGFARAGLVAGNDGAPPRPVPFGADRNGFVPGEAAALLVLERPETAAGRGAAVLGRVRGAGGAFDRSRGADPERAAAALARAVGEALERAGLRPEELACVAAGASGSRRGDAAEAAGLARALGDAASGVPVTSWKGALGEGLGAGGAVAAVLLLESLRTGRLPGIVGIDVVDPELEALDFALEPRRLRGRVGLLTALDRDGEARALVVEAVDGAPERSAAASAQEAAA